MNAIDIAFDWMLTATVRASAMALAVIAIQFAFRRWLPARWRHALWLPVLVVLVLPALPTVPFGLIPAKSEGPATKFAVSASTIESPRVETGDERPTASGATDKKWNVAAIVWFVGTCGVMALFAVAYRKTMRGVERAATPVDTPLLDAVGKVAREAGLSRTPRVIVSTKVRSPAVTGLFRPVLLFPEGFPEGFSTVEFRLILMHECLHLKRWDLPLNWLSCLLQAMHWFNPLLWFAFSRMRVDREAACDARVLSIDAVDRRAEYGGALLKLQSQPSFRTFGLGFVGIFERGSEVKSRIHWISKHRPAHFAAHLAGSVLCMLLLVFGATRADDSSSQEHPVRQDDADQKDDAPHPGEPKPQAEPANDGVAYLVNKLRTIVIPRTEFEDATLEEAVAFLRVRSVELDTRELDPARKGTNFVIRKPRPDTEGKPSKPYGTITMSLKNVPLEKVIKECAGQSGSRYKVDEFSVTFVPVDEIDNQPAPSSPAPTGPAAGSNRLTGRVADEANKIVIPTADFSDASLQEAVDFLNRQAREVAKTKPSVLLVIDPKVDATVRIKNLRLRNVPLAIAATYCANQARLRLAEGDQEIRFMKY